MGLSVDFRLNLRIFGFAVEKVQCDVGNGEQRRENRYQDERKIELVLAALALAAHVVPAAVRLAVDVQAAGLVHAEISV